MSRQEDYERLQIEFKRSNPKEKRNLSEGYIVHMYIYVMYISTHDINTSIHIIMYIKNFEMFSLIGLYTNTNNNTSSSNVVVLIAVNLLHITYTIRLDLLVIVAIIPPVSRRKI